jgi:Zn-dependent M28 family amino/carboxypeptidase
MNKRKKRSRRGAFILIAILVLVGGIIGYAVHFPGRSFRGELPAITQEQTSVREYVEGIVTDLATNYIDRHLGNPAMLNAAADYVEAAFTAMGYTVERQAYDVSGERAFNLIVEIPGATRPDDIYIFGAHYDAVPNCPAANDNASGVAAMLALARYFKDLKPACTVRFVAFTNEEPPYFRTQHMGSLVYANRCRDREENIVGMFSLETMAYFSDEPNSQRYPRGVSWLYPSTGNFIGFVGNTKSQALASETVELFREQVDFPAEGAAMAETITGVGLSDQWSFWRAGYPGLMITDTAFFRYPYYHTAEDTTDKLDFNRFARVVEGLQRVFEAMTGD